MGELNYSEGEMRTYNSEVSAYFQGEADSGRESMSLLQTRKAEYASLMASGSKEDRRRAAEMLRDDEISRWDIWGNQVTADHLNPSKLTLPGSELVAYLRLHYEYPHIKFLAEINGSATDKARNRSLSEAFAACLGNMDRKYPAGSQVAKAAEWFLRGGLGDIVNPVLDAVDRARRSK